MCVCVCVCVYKVGWSSGSVSNLGYLFLVLLFFALLAYAPTGAADGPLDATCRTTTDPELPLVKMYKGKHMPGGG